MKSELNNRLNVLLQQRFVVVCGCKKKSSMRQVDGVSGYSCWTSPDSFTPTPEGGVEVRTQPSPAASPSDPNSRGLRCVCGNKLTAKVNTKVWKESLPSVVSSVTPPRVV